MFSGSTRVRLDNELVVHGFSRIEVLELWDQVQAYFKGNLTLPSDSVVMDVGANIGLFSLLVSKIQPSARIYAFEPIPQIFNKLKTNTRSIPSENIAIYNQGMGAVKKQQNFTYYPRASAMSTAYPYGSDEKDALNQLIDDFLCKKTRYMPFYRFIGKSYRLHLCNKIRIFLFKKINVQSSIVTVSDVIKENAIKKIDLLKIDVEKGEHDVFKGIEEEDWSLIERIAVEIHNVDGRLESVRSLLSARGFVDIDVEKDAEFLDADIYLLRATK